MRTRMVTRTIKTTRVMTMVTNIKDVNNPTIDYRWVTLTGDVNTADITKLCKKTVEQEDGIIFACVMDTTTTEQIYGMTEEEFLLWAKPIER